MSGHTHFYPASPRRVERAPGDSRDAFWYVVCDCGHWKTICKAKALRMLNRTYPSAQREVSSGR